MPGPRFAGLAPALLRHLLGDEICALVDVPRSPWERAMTLNARLGRAFDFAQTAPGLAPLVQMFGASLLNKRAFEMAGGRSASFAIPIPPEMQRRWSASGVFTAVDPESIKPASGE
jgi:hypothetical protein